MNTAHVGLLLHLLYTKCCVREIRIHYVFIQIRMNASLTMEVVNMGAVTILEATRVCVTRDIDWTTLTTTLAMV